MLEVKNVPITFVILPAAQKVCLKFLASIFANILNCMARETNFQPGGMPMRFKSCRYNWIIQYNNHSSNTNISTSILCQCFLYKKTVYRNGFYKHLSHQDPYKSYTDMFIFLRFFYGSIFCFFINKLLHHYILRRTQEKKTFSVH